MAKIRLYVDDCIEMLRAVRGEKLAGYRIVAPNTNVQLLTSHKANSDSSADDSAA